MGYLYGEWPFANLFFGVVFLAAALGVVGIGYWVIRHDRLNRIGEEAEAVDAGDHEPSARPISS